MNGKLQQKQDILEAAPDAFGGLIVKPESLDGNPEGFAQQLDASLTHWKSTGIRVVWLELLTGQAYLIPVAAAAGFVFHHADPSGAVLTKKLTDDARVPPYATHYIGVGGAVFDESDRLLVVSERYRRKNRGHSYKLPGGALRPGEHIVDAAIREVKEETGVLTCFESLGCFRHWHGYRFDRSDIYFICRLSPLTRDIVKQDEEIDDCKWMPVSEYLQREDVNIFNKHVIQAIRERSGLVPSTISGYGTPETHEIFKPDGLYTGESNDGH